MSDRIRAKVIRVRVDKRGATLASTAAVGATQLLVKDAGDLAGDATVAGTLLVGDDSAALLKFADVTFVEDADPGDLTTPDTVKLTAPLTTAIEAGTELFVWETPDDGETDGVVAEVIALCVPEDDQDASESGGPIRAIVPRGMQDDLPPGRADMPVVLEYDEDADEWAVLRLRGRGGGLKFEKDDFYVLTAADITAGAATIPLSRKPVDESVKLWWRTVAQEPTEYTVNASAQTITLPLIADCRAGDRVWVHYAYRVGLAKTTGPVGLTKVGATYQAATSGTYSQLAWPAGTQAGDLFALGLLGDSPTCADARATQQGTTQPIWDTTCAVWTGTVGDPSTPLTSHVNAALSFGYSAMLYVIRPDSPIDFDSRKVLATDGTATIPGLSGSGSGAVGVAFFASGLGGTYSSGTWPSPWTGDTVNGTYFLVDIAIQQAATIGTTPALTTYQSKAWVIGLGEG